MANYENVDMVMSSSSASDSESSGTGSERGAAAKQSRDADVRPCSRSPTTTTTTTTKRRKSPVYDDDDCADSKSRADKRSRVTSPPRRRDRDHDRYDRRRDHRRHDHHRDHRDRYRHGRDHSHRDRDHRRRSDRDNEDRRSSHGRHRRFDSRDFSDTETTSRSKSSPDRKEGSGGDRTARISPCRDDGPSRMNGRSSGPDMHKVMERVDRLRRQGCMAAYQQIMSGVQQPQSSRPNLPAHSQPQCLLPSPPLINRPPPARLPSATSLPLSASAQAAQLNIPKFYNPAAINVAKIADQERKKKLLWGNKSQQNSTTTTAAAAQPAAAWKPVAAFEQDNDGKMTAKFLRLMGVKNAEQTATGDNDSKSETVEKQRQMFNDMEQQYEQARVSTHTQRGFGLGYTAQYYLPKS